MLPALLSLSPVLELHRRSCRPITMTRIGLAVLVVLLLGAGRASANGCGLSGEPCCFGSMTSPPICITPGLVCDPNNTTGCGALVWQGGGQGGAAELVCPGTCVQPTATPTSTGTPTPTATNTPTPTGTPTPTSTPTATASPHSLPDGDPCTANTQCASGLCKAGVCSSVSAAPAVSNRNVLFLAVGLLLVGLWSMRRVARQRNL
jgi:hypothetical protein